MKGFLSRLLGRKPARRAPVMLRGYDAAKDSQFLQGWNGDMGVSANMVRAELPAVRAKVRNLSYNEPLVQRALQLYRANIIGPNGIKFTADVPDSGGGVDLDASDRLEKAWRLWSETPGWCDLEGRNTLTGILHEACDSLMRDGEALMALHSGADNPFGFSVRLLRPDALATDLVRPSSQGSPAILNGVEVNADGRALAYHLYAKVSTSGVYHGRTVRVPAGRILHVFRRDYPGATRGFPVFASVAGLLKMLSAYREAETVAARLGAMRSGGTYELDSGALDPSQIASVEDGGLFQNVQAGEIRIAPYGYHYQPDTTPAHPNAAYGTFVKTLLQQMASGLNLSYNTLASDLEGVSYSSIRSGVLEDRESYKVVQELFISSVLRPLFRRPGAWLDCWLLKGGGGFSVADADRLRAADTWLPRRWPWVDPLKDQTAHEIAVAHGWESDSDVAAESGKDYWDNVATMRQERDWRRRCGVGEPPKRAAGTETPDDAADGESAKEGQ